MTGLIDSILLYPFTIMVASIIALAVVLASMTSIKALRVTLALLILAPISPLLILRGMAVLIVNCIDAIKWPFPFVVAARYLHEITN